MSDVGSESDRVEVQNQAIFETAWHHDADRSQVWRTMVIRADGRTPSHAAVTLFSRTGEEWEYELDRPHGDEWVVTSEKLADVETSTVSDRTGVVAMDGAPSTTDPVAVGRLRSSDTFQTWWDTIFFTPIDGYVISELDLGLNEYDYAEWLPASEITYGDGTWQVEWDYWFACADRFFIDLGSGYICDYEPPFSQGDINISYNGSTYDAAKVYLRYYARFIPPLDPNVASVVISPDTLYIPYRDSADVSATAYNSASQPLSGKTAEWTVENGYIATVRGTGGMTGRVMAENTGQTRLFATVEGETGQVPVIVTPLVEASGPSYVYQGSGNVEAGPVPSGGSYYYEWQIRVCVADPYVPPTDCHGNVYSYSASGQDATTQSFYMQPEYDWIKFQVTLRFQSGERILDTANWTVDGAGEYQSCEDPICPESIGLVIR